MNTVDSYKTRWWQKLPAILLWATVLYAIWNWTKFLPVWLYGDLQGPDSFLRLHQVQNWLSGQGWFDLTAYQMAPPEGADIHWSRLVDLPIAALIVLFDIFLEADKAAWLAAIVWPYLLFLATLWVVLGLCQKLIENCNPLLVLFFYVLSISVLAETAPGRVDHHNVQIFLFAVSLLGLVMKPGWKSDSLVGLVIPLSLSIGMDSAALFLPLLALIGMQWAFRIPDAGSRLLRIGISMLVTCIIIYVATIPAERWFDNRCDAFSLFYLTALVNLSVGFLVLGWLGQNVEAFRHSKLNRFIAGIAVAALAAGSLLWVFPHCASGPYGNLDHELVTRWLDRVEEAKGIFGAGETSPQRWFGDFLYIWLMAGLAFWITVRNYRQKPEFIVLLCAIMICAIGIFFQIRILRTGVIAAIPVCVATGMVVTQWLGRKSFELAAARVAALGLVCFTLTSFFWYSVGNLALGKETRQNLAKTANMPSENAVSNDVQRTRRSCSGSDALAELAGTPAGIIMSDMNLATPIMLHTHHKTIAGPYHRNGPDILAVLDFFETDLNTSRKLAEQYGITHVAYCNRNRLSASGENAMQLRESLASGKAPDWLEWVSAKDDLLLVLKVR